MPLFFEPVLSFDRALVTRQLVDRRSNGIADRALDPFPDIPDRALIASSSPKTGRWTGYGRFFWDDAGHLSGERWMDGCCCGLGRLFDYAWAD